MKLYDSEVTSIRHTSIQLRGSTPQPTNQDSNSNSLVSSRISLPLGFSCAKCQGCQSQCCSFKAAKATFYIIYSASCPMFCTCCQSICIFPFAWRFPVTLRRFDRMLLPVLKITAHLALL